MADRNFFYTAEPNYKSVSYIELCQFLEDYPRQIKSHETKFPQGTFTTYYDEEICDRFPYGKVASITKEGERISCIIIDNYEELYNTRTGYRDVHAKEMTKENMKKNRALGLILSTESELERRFLEI